MADVSATLEKLKKLDAERKTLLEATKMGIVEAIESQISSLKDLGFDYQLVESGSRGATGRRERKAGGRVCSVCHRSGHNSRTCPDK
ncbi:MAG: hypothetical protein C0504_05805 [Candidatus Solibacter sp.]|nr:hypothetical protein [Candidatus Solibacter sp.]